MKYLGSKSQFAKQIVPLLQKYINENNISYYIEPFVGGANIIDKIECENKIGNDNNLYLIALLQATRDKKEFPLEISKEHYFEVRDSWKNNENKYEPYYVGLVGFLASFRGKFFTSCACYDYESEGRIRNNYKESLNNLLKQQDNLQGVEFISDDYKDILYKIPEGEKAVIYCDPPYSGGYTYEQEFNHNEFWNWVREASKKHIVIVSEYNAPNDFIEIWSREKKMVLQAQSDRFTVVEKLFIYNNK